MEPSANDSRPEQGAGFPPDARNAAERLRRGRLLRRLSPRAALAAFVFAASLGTIAVCALLAMATRTPFVFPSLGPTAFLLFFTPTATVASPRATLYGHAIGIVCGFGALWVTGLAHAPPALAGGVDMRRVIAAALSIGATGAAMILLRAVHPPAGATTLIVSLGIVSRPAHLALIELAIAALVVQAALLHRAAGIDYPLGVRHRAAGASGRSTREA